MSIPPPLQVYQNELIKLCEQFNVAKLYAFGSVLTNRFDKKKSDIDLLVELEPMDPVEKGMTLLQFWDALEALFNRRVDLLTDKPVKNEFLKNSIDRTKQLIYERRREKVSY